MPNSLENQFISDGYIGQLHVGLTTLSSGNISTVFDGDGNPSSLSLSVSGGGASITGSLTSGKIAYPSVETPLTIVDYFYPVGSVFLSFSNTNPSTRFSGTTWQQISQGLFLVGAGTGTDGNNTSMTFSPGRNTNGDYSTTLTSDQVPDHYHYIDANSYMAWERNPAGFGTFEYRLDGLAAVANVGRTSGVVRTQAISGITTTNPSYGLYVWLRTQ
jgi:hypothetical protein